MVENHDAFLFGGSMADIKATQEHYLPYFENKSPVLDIGCGRGIFLLMLADRGIKAEGVDLNDEAIAEARSLGFTVHKDDVVGFLQHGKHQYGGIFASHILEHVDSDNGIELIRACAKSLEKGGIFIVATPNTDNPRVMTQTFWLDLDHKRPYPRILIEQLMQDAGLTVVDSGANPYMKTIVSRGLVTWQDRKAHLIDRIRHGGSILLGDTFVVGTKP